MNLTELLRLILNLVRKGTISAVDHDAGKCRVKSGDLETNWIRWLAFAAGETRDWNPPTVGEQVLLLCPGGDPADAVALRGIFTNDAPPPSSNPATHTRTYPDGALVEYDHEQHAMRATLPEGATVNLVAPGSVTVKTSAATVEADTVLVKADTVTVQASNVTVEADSVTIDAPITTCTGNLTVQKLLTYQGGMTGKPGAGGGAAATIEGNVAVTGEITASTDVKAGSISLANHTHMEQGDGKAVSKPQ